MDAIEEYLEVWGALISKGNKVCPDCRDNHKLDSIFRAPDVSWDAVEYIREYILYPAPVIVNQSTNGRTIAKCILCDESFRSYTPGNSNSLLLHFREIGLGWLPTAPTTSRKVQSVRMAIARFAMRMATVSTDNAKKKKNHNWRDSSKIATKYEARLIERLSNYISS